MHDPLALETNRPPFYSKVIEIVRPSFWAGMITVIKALSHLTLLKYAAIFHGPSMVGIIGQAMGVTTLLQNFAGGGISNGLIRNFSLHFDNRKKRNEFLAYGFTYGLIFSIAILILCYAFPSLLANEIFGNGNYGWIMWIVGLLSIAAFIGSFSQSLLIARGLVRKIFVAQLCAWVCVVPLFFFLTRRHATSGAIVGGLSILFFQGLFLFAALSRESWFQDFRFRLYLNTRAIKDLLPFTLISLISGFLVPAILVLLRADVEGSLGWAAVGYWQSMLKISEVCFSFFSMVVASTYFPKVSQRIDQSHAIHETKAFLAGYIPPLGALLFLLGLLGKYVLTLVFTGDFAFLEHNLRILLLGDLFRSVGWVMSFLLMARNHLAVYFWAETALAILLYAMCRFGMTMGLDQLVQMQALHSVLYCITLIFIGLVLAKFRRL